MRNARPDPLPDCTVARGRLRDPKPGLSVAIHYPATCPDPAQETDSALTELARRQPSEQDYTPLKVLRGIRLPALGAEAFVENA